MNRILLVLLFFTFRFVAYAQVPEVPTPLCQYCGNPLPQDPVSTSNPDYARIHHKSSCPYYPGNESGQSSVNQGPTQEELNIYYNQQWTDQLNQQADIDFRKGMKAMEEGNCEKAVRHFNMAKRMVSLKIYEDAYNAALNCTKKDQIAGQNTQTEVDNDRPQTIVTTPTNPQSQTTPSNVRPRGEQSSTTTTAQMESMLMKKVIAKEQEDMESNTETWVEYQKRQFQQRISQPNYWCEAYYKELLKLDTTQTSLESVIPMKKQSQLEPGDVILIGPLDTKMSNMHAKMDGWLNENNASVTHTVTCVKVVDGKRIFLDNQASTGPRLISEEEFIKRYGNREASVASVRETVWGVAQPLNEEQSKALWELARKMVNNNRENNGFITDYGLYGNDDMVCSETSWALLNATGRFKIPFDVHIPVLSGIKFTPASFFNAQQYFLITPLQLGQ